MTIPDDDMAADLAGAAGRRRTGRLVQRVGRVMNATAITVRLCVLAVAVIVGFVTWDQFLR